MRTIIIFSLIFSCIIGWSDKTQTVFADSIQLEDEIKKLEAAASAWKYNDAEFRKMRAMGQAADTELREFAEFVAELRRNVIEECEAVRSMGGDADQYDVCSMAASMPGIDDVSIPLDAADLSAPVDESDLYEQELRMLEGDFDNILMTARDELQKKNKADGAGSVSGGNLSANAAGSKHDGKSSNSEGTDGTKGRDGGSKEGKYPKNKNTKKSNGQNTGAGETRDSGTQGTAGKTQDEGKGSGHLETGDRSDDDIIARQLREAAEKETDPVLKEQLWKEYEKYKKSKQ